MTTIRKMIIYERQSKIGAYFQVIFTLKENINIFDMRIEITAPQIPNNGIKRKFDIRHTIPPHTLVEK